MANENNYLFMGLGSGTVEVPSNLQLIDKDQTTVLFSVNRTNGNITAPIAGVNFSGVPSAGQVLKATSSTAATWQADTTGSPAGSNSQIQFNNSGSFGASAGLVWDGTRISATSVLLGNVAANNNSTLQIGPRTSGPVSGRTILEMDNGTSAFTIETNGAQTALSISDALSDLKLSANASNGLLLKNTSGLVIVQGRMQFNDNSTGSGEAALGANCPAVTAAAPYTWVKIQTSDGSVAYVPAWK